MDGGERLARRVDFGTQGRDQLFDAGEVCARPIKIFRGFAVAVLVMRRADVGQELLDLDDVEAGVLQGLDRVKSFAGDFGRSVDFVEVALIQPMRDEAYAAQRQRNAQQNLFEGEFLHTNTPIEMAKVLRDARVRG